MFIPYLDSLNRDGKRLKPIEARIAPRSGFTLIELLVVVSIISLLLQLLLVATQEAREAARRFSCANNLKQIGLALANYESTLGAYPFGVGGGGPKDLVARWSPQSQLLPFMEQQPLFNSLNFSSVSWMKDTPIGLLNNTALKTVVSGFLCPSDPDEIGDQEDPLWTAHNSYRANAGTLPYNLLNDSPDRRGLNNGPFYYQSSTRSASVVDGLSNTAFFSERCLGTPEFIDPLADYYFQSKGALEACRTSPGLTARFSGNLEWSGQRWADGNVFYTRYHHILTPLSPSCLLGGSQDYNSPVLVSSTSRHPGGVNLLLGDGSVRFAKETISLSVWQALGTVSGGEVIGQDSF